MSTTQVIQIRTTQEIIGLTLFVDQMIAQQDVAIEVLAAGTAAMIQGGAHPWEVALVAYYFNCYLSHHPASAR